MIGITNIAHYIPQCFESNFDKLEKFSVEESFIRDKLGVHRVSRMLEDEETSDLCVKAFQALECKPEKVDCLIVCTQNPDGHGIPHTSAIVHRKLDLSDECACFDLSLGCSGYVYSLSVIQAFMQTHGMKSGLLFTADPYSKILDTEDRNTTMLFGDAATVTLLEEINPTTDNAWLPDKFIFQTSGKGGEALNCDSGTLVMNGRAVFNFAMQKVPVQIKRLLDSVDLVIDDVDCFALHQGSRFIVEQISKRLGISTEKVPLVMQEYGNTISSSIPLILEDAFKNRNINKIIMSGFGVGLSWASCLATRYSEE